MISKTRNHIDKNGSPDRKDKYYLSFKKFLNITYESKTNLKKKLSGFLKSKGWSFDFRGPKLF